MRECSPARASRPFGEKQIGDIREGEHRAVRRGVSRNDQSIKRTRTTNPGFLHSVFDFTLRRGWVGANPCKAVEKPETSPLRRALAGLMSSAAGRGSHSRSGLASWRVPAVRVPRGVPLLGPYHQPCLPDLRSPLCLSGAGVRSGAIDCRCAGLAGDQRRIDRVSIAAVAGGSLIWYSRCGGSRVLWRAPCRSAVVLSVAKL